MMCRKEVDLEKPFSEEGYALMGAVFEVHKELGGGLLEEIYQQSLEMELQLRDIPFHAKESLAVFYKGQKLEKRYVPDLFVNTRMVVELKSVSELTSAHKAQLINYLKIARAPVGYLVNFGPVDKVEWRRFVLSEFAQSEWSATSNTISR